MYFMPLIKHKRKHRFPRNPRLFNFFRKNSQVSFARGNRVELYAQGGSFLPALLKACREAREELCLEFYIIRDDAIGRLFAAELASAVARGVAVCLIYDYVGCFDTPGFYFRQLEHGGVKCLAFNPPPFRRGIAWFDKRDHRKMAVIDGKTAFAGGINIADEYAGFGESPKKWRDLGMRIDGPAAGELRKLFRASWEDESGAVPFAWAKEEHPVADEGDAEVMVVNGGPHHNRSIIHSAFRMAIAGAAESVRIINPYFVPGPRVVRSLLRAAARGVRVQLILPAKNDVPLVRLVSRSYYSQLLKGGIEIFEREGTVLHAKLMLIDESWAVVGSANLDQRSFHRNYEVNLIVDNPAFGRQVAEMFGEDLARSRRIVIEEHERRGFFLRIMEWLCGSVSWFL
jgi:cardiolipin synthase